MLNEDELKQTQRALDYFLANFDLTTSEKRAAERAYEKLDPFIDGDSIASVWSVEDVYSLDGDNFDEQGNYTGKITPEQAREVLQRVDHYHDASIGINWEVLQVHLDDVLGGE